MCSVHRTTRDINTALGLRPGVRPVYLFPWGRGFHAVPSRRGEEFHIIASDRVGNLNQIFFLNNFYRSQQQEHCFFVVSGDWGVKSKGSPVE